MNIGVILAGGTGNRFGSKIPKQFLKIKNKEVISYAIKAFQKSETTEHVIVVSHKDFVEHIKEVYGITCIEGGTDRNKTVFNALQFIRKNFPNCDKVIFADSARPMLTPDYIGEVDKLLDSNDGVITVAKITDSLGKKNYGFIDREDYYLIQTPEAFRIEALKDFDPNSSATALIQQVESEKINYCDKLGYNFKITYPMDLKIAEALLEE